MNSATMIAPVKELSPLKRLPSVDTLALLTAIMGKSAQEAIQHWRDCEWELNAERVFPEGIGLRVPLAETMERLGIHAEPTMKKLLRAYLPHLKNADFETRWDKARRHGFDIELIEELRKTQRERNAERGRKNRANAMKKRKRGKPVK